MPKTFGTDVLLSVTSGKMICDNFGLVQQAGDFITGSPTMTHNYASKDLWERMKDFVVAQHPWMGDEDQVFADYPDIEKIRSENPNDSAPIREALDNWFEVHVYSKHPRELELTEPAEPQPVGLFDGMPSRFLPGGEDEDKLLVIGVDPSDGN